MRTLDRIYQNGLGCSYKIITDENIKYIALEIHQVSFLINDKELKSFINSIETIISHHKDCTCPPELENKLVIYKAKQTEIRMLLSANQLFLLKDLLKGTHFKLSMNSILKEYKIE